VDRCFAARSRDDALTIAARDRPDVALVDLFLGEQSGAELCAQLNETVPGIRVLLISGAGRISQAVARSAGASGFVAKDWAAADVVRAVRMVALGQEVFAPAPDEPARALSTREREVVVLIARGATNAEIAGELYLSPHTVKEHTSAIYRKLGVRNRAAAVQAPQRLGLVS
jgi:DNA-binding NarL/FixJ family response regulator